MVKLSSIGFYVWSCGAYLAGAHHDQILKYFSLFWSMVLNSTIWEQIQTMLKGYQIIELFTSRPGPTWFSPFLGSLTSEMVDTKLTDFVPISTVYALVFGALWLLWPSLLTRKPTAIVEEILMFPDKSGKNLDIVVKMLDDAKYSLDVCVFTITNDSIEDALLRAHTRGLKVRIISDDLQMKCRGCELVKLCRKGIDVKHDANLSKFMHHKFCIIDQSLLLTGSFNWTAAAWKKNNENLIALSGSEVVARYQDEFDLLWSGFTSLIERRQRKGVCGRMCFWL